MTRPLLDRLEPRQLLANVVFEIDRRVSQLDIDASIDIDGYGDVDLDPQADGLDTAPLAGSIAASVTNAGVRLYGGNTIELVEEDGDFDPGDAPAAWALDAKERELGITLAEIDAAFRDVTFDLSNTKRSKVENRTKRFDFRNATLEATGGRIDYAIDSKFGDGDGDESLDGLRGALDRTRAKLSGGVGSRAITIPILARFELDVDEGTVEFTISGQIVARERQTSIAAPAIFSSRTFRDIDLGDILNGVTVTD